MPQEYDDYHEQQTARPANRNQQQHHHQQQKNAKADDRETTTFVPIIHYDKEQNVDGSYQTQSVHRIFINVDVAIISLILISVTKPETT